MDFHTPVRSNRMMMNEEDEDVVIDLIPFQRDYSPSFVSPLLQSPSPMLVTPENHPAAPLVFHSMITLPIRRNLFYAIEDDEEEYEQEEEMGNDDDEDPPIMTPPSPEESVVFMSMTMAPRRLFDNVIDLTGDEEPVIQQRRIKHLINRPMNRQ